MTCERRYTDKNLRIVFEIDSPLAQFQSHIPVVPAPSVYSVRLSFSRLPLPTLFLLPQIFLTRTLNKPELRVPQLVIRLAPSESVQSWPNPSAQDPLELEPWYAFAGYRNQALRTGPLMLRTETEHRRVA